MPEGDYVIPIGKSKVQRPGKDVTIVTYSKGLEISMKAADELAKAGIEAEIVDLRSLRPLDMDPVIESFKKTNRAVVVEEGWKSFGVGAEVSARIYEQAFDYVDAPVRRVAQKEVPLPYNRTLEQSALPQVAGRGCGGQGGAVMAETISMPKLGFDMAEGTLVRWVKKIGETISKGDVLAEIETDKATVEVESSASGVVRKLLVDEGAVVPVNHPIAIVGTAEEGISEQSNQRATEKWQGIGKSSQLSAISHQLSACNRPAICNQQSSIFNPQSPILNPPGFAIGKENRPGAQPGYEPHPGHGAGRAHRAKGCRSCAGGRHQSPTRQPQFHNCPLRTKPVPLEQTPPGDCPAHGRIQEPASRIST